MTSASTISSYRRGHFEDQYQSTTCIGFDKAEQPRDASHRKTQITE